MCCNFFPDCRRSIHTLASRLKKIKILVSYSCQIAACPRPTKLPPNINTHMLHFLQSNHSFDVVLLLVSPFPSSPFLMFSAFCVRFWFGVCAKDFTGVFYIVVVRILLGILRAAHLSGVGLSGTFFIFMPSSDGWARLKKNMCIIRSLFCVCL